MRQLSLDITSWTVKAVGDLSAVPVALRNQQVPAQVPGCVHTDLLRARLIPDPLVGMNEREVQWIGETDWEYRAIFEADSDLLKHERVDLVCDGLDTIAEIRLNNVEVGRAANMFHPHRFDLRPTLRPGPNDLSITFRSPLKHILAEEQRLGKRPVNGDWDPYIFIRKAACNFGWDWAPKLATCGIWKPIHLEGWTGIRIAAVRPSTTRIDSSRWEVGVAVSLDWSGPAQNPPLVVGVLLRFGRDTHGRPFNEWRFLTPRAGEREVRTSIAVSDPQLWEPNGGAPRAPLCMLQVSINSPTNPGGYVHEWTRDIGFREVKLKTPKDEQGAAFILEVNGREVFCKGANWIPEGPWSAEPSREKLRERLVQAVAANMNMLRVWGGGYYESDAFYELCDELGIMVWQDFMFACAMYPEEEPYPTLIEAEARHQISRLSSHPSVTLWCGGNECTWAHDAWGNAPGEKPWKERLEDKTWGEGYYFDLLPRLLKELDPTRPYWPNSPWPGSKDLAPNSADHGDRHTWDLRGDGYRKHVPRFCSEFGHQSPSNYATLARVLTPGDFKIGSPALEHRQRATGGTARHIDEAIAETFRRPRDFDEWHYLAQLTQARAMKTGIEWMRVNRPRCMGALIWQLNDCWPGMSWSLIDSDGREKLAYFAAHDAFRNRLITIQPFDGKPWLCAVNDNDKPAEFVVHAKRVGFDGAVHAEIKRLHLECPPGSALRAVDLEAALGKPSDPRRELIHARCQGHRPTWFYLPDRELVYPKPDFEASFHESHGDGFVHVQAKSFLRDLVMLANGEEPPATPQVVTLLPGESVDFYWGSGVVPTAGDRAFQCANTFGAGT